jgi:sterol desaturase/sphingolipid hydroxylase (fatty acid hydroxylase superfamily)
LFVAVPAVLGFKILSLFISVHIFSLLIWLTFRAVDSCDSHCGYEWSWSQSSVLPLATGYEYHNFHHSKNVGNFGSFFKLWDCLLGTNLHFLNLLKLRN